jgi:Predicted integral membrane protein
MAQISQQQASRWLTWRPDKTSRRLALVAAPVFILELVLAWTTKGTFDVEIWQSFADSVRRVGPIDIYNLPLEEAGPMVYNHAPLTGWWLVIVNGLASIGVPVGATVRTATTVAHLLTSFLILAILRPRVGETWALRSAIAVALSPVLVIISGFHGNNDPSVALLTIASVWLLVDRRAPFLAGLAFAAAVSVKLIPVIALPLLLVAAWGVGRARTLLRLVLGGLTVVVLFWVPVLIWARDGFVTNVLGYDGSGFPRQWGFYQLGVSLEVPQRLLWIYEGKGTYLVLALCALVPAWAIRRQPERAPAALGLSMAMFLFLTPAWATQYGSYPAATIFLVEFWPALITTVVTGLIYVTLYIWWGGDVRTLTPPQYKLLFFAWASLVPVVVAGLRSFLWPRLPWPRWLQIDIGESSGTSGSTESGARTSGSGADPSGSGARAVRAKGTEDTAR